MNSTPEGKQGRGTDSPTGKRRKRRWRRFLLYGLVAFFACILAAPWLARPWLRGQLQSRLAAALPGTAALDAVELEWGGGFAVRRLQLEGEDGDTWCTLGRLQADFSWWELLRGRYRLTVEVEDLVITLDPQDPAGWPWQFPDDRERREGPRSQPKAPKKSERKAGEKSSSSLPEIALNLDFRNVEIRLQGGSQASLQHRFDGRLSWPGSTEELRLELDWQGAETSGQGRFEMACKLDPGAPERWQQSAGRLELAWKQADLEAWQDLLAAWGVESIPRGKGEGRLAAEWKAGPVWTATFESQARDLALASTAGGGPPLDWPSLAIRGSWQQQAGGDGTHQLEVEVPSRLQWSYLGRSQWQPAAGLAEPGHWEGEWHGQGGLAQFLALAGEASPLRQDVQLDGEALWKSQWQVHWGEQGLAATEAKVELAVESLAATDGIGRQLDLGELRQIRLDGSGSWDWEQSSGHLQDLALNLGPIQIHGQVQFMASESGGLPRWGPSELQGSADLDRLQELASRIFASGALPELAGRLRLEGRAESSGGEAPEEATSLHFRLIGEEVEWQVPPETFGTTEIWQGGPADFALQSDGQWSDQGFAADWQLQAAALGLSGQGKLATGAEPTSWQEWLGQGELQGQLDVLEQVLGPLWPESGAEIEAAGPVRLSWMSRQEDQRWLLDPVRLDWPEMVWRQSEGSALRLGPGQALSHLGQTQDQRWGVHARLHLEEIASLEGEEAAVAWQEREVKLELAAAWAEELLQLDILKLTSPSAELQCSGRWPLAEESPDSPTSAELSLQGSASLAEWLPRLASSVDPATYPLEGRLTLAGSLKGQEGNWAWQGESRIHDLVASRPAEGDQPAAELRQEEVVLKHRFQLVQQQLQLQEFSVQSDFLRGKLNGGLRLPEESVGDEEPTHGWQAAPEIRGDFYYRPGDLGVLLHPWLPGRLEGDQEERLEWQFSGPLAELDWMEGLRRSEGRLQLGMGSLAMTGLQTAGQLNLDLAGEQAKAEGRFQLNGGTLQVNSVLDLHRPVAEDSSAKPHSQVALELQGVQAHTSMGSWLSFLHPALAGAAEAGGEEGELSGLLHAKLNLEFDGILDPTRWQQEGLDAVPLDALRGDGELSWNQARLQGSPLFGEMLQRLGLDPGQSLDLQPLRFRVRQGRVRYAEPWTWSMGGVKTSFQGSIGLDQSLRLQWQVPVTRKLVQRYGFLSALKGQNIQIPVAGTLSRPRLRWDQALEDLAQQAVGKQAEEALEKPLDGVLGDLLGRDKEEEKQASRLLKRADRAYQEGRRTDALEAYLQLRKDFKRSPAFQDNRERVLQRINELRKDP
ncbi:MAG: hypothetical protein DWQ01_21660 [Planctomycetota bacterium]|nr:MAG: hypothetical protein DWQ01_21660 [Planctomycetota bacterium]